MLLKNDIIKYCTYGNRFLTKNISEISTDTPPNNSVLKYDSTQSKFVPTNLWPFKVETTLPVSGNLGDVVIVNDVFNIWDGTSWISI